MSCSNQIQKGTKGFTTNPHWAYKDPELTLFGVIRSQNLSSKLLEIIKGKWAEHDWALGTSPMIRAIQTAYFMLSKDTDKKINIFPHIGEISGLTRTTGLSVFKTVDNTPLPLAEQIPIIKASVPSIEQVIGDDLRGDVSNSETFSSFRVFKEWAKGPGLSSFVKGDDDVYRAVIVTHSNFIQKIFPDILKERKIRNNEAIYFDWDTELVYKKGVSKNLLNIQLFDYGLNDKDVLYMCPDDCRMATGCKKGAQSPKNEARFESYVKNIERIYNRTVKANASSGGKKKKTARNRRSRN